MTEPIWLSEKYVLELHNKIIDRTGGAQGIRDLGLLQSALARPQNIYEYGQKRTAKAATKSF